MASGHKIMMLGPPGAGKGTQAKKMTASLGLPHISTGDMLRQAKRNDTPMGKRAAPYMDQGKLVPDEVVIGIVAEALNSPELSQGFILDGFPRTLGQARALGTMGVHLDHVINIVAKDETLIDRISGRRTCPNCGATYHTRYHPSKVQGVCDVCGHQTQQRKDDSPESVTKRLQEYAQETEPLIAFYRDRGNLKDIDGEQSPELVSAQITRALEG